MKAPATLKPHVIEFPFTFSYSEIHYDLKGLDPLLVERKGIILCRGHSLTIEQRQQLEQLTNQTVEEMWGTPNVLRERFMNAKYFIYLRPEHVSSRGNAMAEAVSAGVLGISGNNLMNRDLTRLSNCIVENFEQAYQLIEQLEKDPEKYDFYREEQAKMFNFLLYDRPLYQLLERSQKVYDIKNS
jgi:hypothetical protein